ncbi:MAG: DUF2935 domain-containing protein [Ignavibacteriales bacterium]
MLNNEMFISKSIDLHLFFMRIIEEHLIFIQSSIPAKNTAIKQEAETLRQELLKLFSFIMSISSGHISQNVINSGELITKYTHEAEELSEYYTGLEIDSNYTINEKKLLASENSTYEQIPNEQMINLNNHVIDIIKKVTDFQKKFFDAIQKCEIFTSMFSDRLDHIIDESNHYIVEIEKLQSMNLTPTLNSLNEEMIFWNENLSDHGIFTALRLDPTEKELAKISMDFADNFEKLADEAKNAGSNATNIIDLINRSLQETIKYKEANIKDVESLLYCKVKSIILPLGAEHDLRELNHYLRILKDGKKYLNI